MSTITEVFTDPQTAGPTSKRQFACCSKALCNILLLGMGFFFSLGTLLACLFAQTVFLSSIHDSYFQGTPTIGYTCLAINFASLTISYMLSPPLSAVVGPKLLIVIGAVFLTVSMTVYFRPLEITLYLGSIAQGIGCGIMWTVYGYFLTVNSTSKTVGRNTGIFWAIFHTGPVCWNLYFFLLNTGSTDTERIRIDFFAVLLPVSGLGVVTLSLLRHPWMRNEKNATDPDGAQTSWFVFRHALLGVLKLAVSKKMLFLCPMFLYMGIEMTFWMNVYGTALGYTLRFGAMRDRLVGLNGVRFLLTSATGGFVYGMCGGSLRKRGRDVGILAAFLFHVLAFFIAFLILPERSALEVTDGVSYVTVRPLVSLVCSFLLGFGDAGWNNPLCSLLEALYPENPVSAFAVFQAYQAFGNVISFAYSSVLTVPYQLVIMVVASVIGLCGFCVVEWKVATEEAKAALALSKNETVASKLSEISTNTECLNEAEL